MVRAIAIWSVITTITFFTCLSGNWSVARAGSLKGNIILPEQQTAMLAVKSPGYWLVPNELLEATPLTILQPPPVVVSLKSLAPSHTPLPKPSTVIENARFNPPIVIVNPGTKLTIENRETALHLLESVGSSLMSSVRASAGSTVEHVITNPGIFLIHCSEFPYVMATIIVDDGQYAVAADSLGHFVLPELPNGNYSVAIWLKGKQVHQETVAVNGKTTITLQPKLK